MDTTNCPIILVVDDAPTNIQMLAQMLRGKYRIKVASCGQTALEIARQTPQPDLIMLDILMPDMDGFEVCRFLKEDSLTREIPVIFITAAEDAESERRGLELGAVDYLTKPVNSVTAMARIENHLNLVGLKQQMESFFRLSPSLICIADPDGRLHQLNIAWQKVLGYAPAELEGTRLLDYVHPDDVPRTLRNTDALFRGEEVKGMVSRFRARDGSWRWLEWHANAVKGLVFFSALDVTERVEWEARLQLTQFVNDHASVEILWVDVHARLLYANECACKSLGYTQAELLALSIWDINPGYPPALWDEYWQKLKCAKTLTFDSVHRRRDGSSCHVEVNANYVKHEDTEYSIAFVRDITERKQNEEVLLRWSNAFNHAGIGLALGNDETRNIIAVNPAFARMLGHTPQEIMGKRILENYHPEVRDLVARYMKVANEKGHVRYESRMLHKDGGVVPVQVDLVGVRDEKGAPAFRVASVQDITERKKAEELLRMSEDRYRQLVETSPDAIILHQDGKLIFVNPAAITLFAADDAEQMLGGPVLDLVHRDSRELVKNRVAQMSSNMSVNMVEEKLVRFDGSMFDAEVSASAVVHQGRPAFQVIARDITMRKQHEAQLSHIAHYDSLTAIPNRVLLADRMKQAIAQSIRDERLMAVCYLDLDGFKQINDIMGHDVGDRILVEIANRLNAFIRGGDTAARLGGDEFVLLLLGLEEMGECNLALNRILAAISAPIMLEGKTYLLSASIGVAIFPFDNDDADTLLRHADQAMYVAKQSGKNRYHLYDTENDLKVRADNEVLRSVSHGLANGEFELYFQPKVQMNSCRMIGAEALIRWNHPERGLLPPGEFLRVIEDTDVEFELGNFVIDTALAQLAVFDRQGLEIQVSINISARHLLSAGFVEDLQARLAQRPDVPSGRLQIEILETAALDDIVLVSEIIERCHAFGVGFALDDFGTGYSSLMYLSNLPVDVLKIDQSFVLNMLDDKGDRAIVQGIVALATAFDLDTVAEGIETKALYDELQVLGCLYGQGYGIARPMPAAQLLLWKPAACC